MKQPRPHTGDRTTVAQGNEDFVESGALSDFFRMLSIQNAAYISARGDRNAEERVKTNATRKLLPAIPEPLAIPELLLQIFRLLPNKEVFQLRRVCHHFRDLAYQAYTDRKSTYIRISLVMLDTRSYLKEGEIAKIEELMTQSAYPNPKTITDLPRGCTITTAILKCHDHLLIDSTRLAAKFIPLHPHTELLKSETIWDSSLVAFQLHRIRPPTDASSPLTGTTPTTPITPPIFRRIASTPSHWGTIRDGIYGPDFILTFSVSSRRPLFLRHPPTPSHTLLHISEVVIPYGWINTTALGQRND
ncbi:hypothetical protein HK097_003854, partial [Rhizophlyctis rosea]